MSELLKPPAVPAAILNFFASQPDFPAVAGDISEEFHQRAANLGANSANRWYWRQVFRNAFALTWRELARTPFRTALVVIGCYLGTYVLIDLYAFLRYYPLPALSIFNDQRHWGVNHLVNFIACLAMGGIGGWLLRGREWALTLIFALVSACLTLPGAWYLFFVLKATIPARFKVFFIVGLAVRPSAFALGSLWIRVHSRSFASKGASQHV